MNWFLEDNLDLVTLYFGEPDSTGHKYGPESQERKNMVSQVDRAVGYLRRSIKDNGLESTLNLIITSDHGMETVIKENEIYLRTVQNFSFQDIQFELLDYGPNGLLVPKANKLDQVYQALKNAHPKLHVYKKEEFPKRFHYANNTRLTPLMVYSDPGYLAQNRPSLRQVLAGGEHGFDNEDMNMKTIFRAAGPAFRKGLEVEPFESVNIYPLLCNLLGITPDCPGTFIPHTTFSGYFHAKFPLSTPSYFKAAYMEYIVTCVFSECGKYGQACVCELKYSAPKAKSSGNEKGLKTEDMTRNATATLAREDPPCRVHGSSSIALGSASGLALLAGSKPLTTYAPCP
uniref:Ectonucleotide pyrophosphatase/phosphodiesterase 7 n=1 Tax=Chrysemys picta bellii TaxID=8478 RepID=A0A8C3FVN8_CHRPI